MFPINKALALVNLYPLNTFVAGVDGYGFVTLNGHAMHGFLAAGDIELFYFKMWEDEPVCV